MYVSHSSLAEGGASDLAEGNRQRFHGPGDLRAASRRKCAASDVRAGGREGKRMPRRGKVMWHVEFLGWWLSIADQRERSLTFPWLWHSEELRFNFWPYRLRFTYDTSQKVFIKLWWVTYAILRIAVSKAVGKQCFHFCNRSIIYWQEPPRPRAKRIFGFNNCLQWISQYNFCRIFYHLDLFY